MDRAAKIFGVTWSNCGALFALLLLSLLNCAHCAYAKQQAASTDHGNTASRTASNIEFASLDGYPELRLGGQPFFVHAAEFSYFSIPRDLWEHTLDSYKELGFNTIELRIPWNWHEPHEGEFDFDGHTNPRRDLRTLLGLIFAKGLKLIAAPGPLLGPVSEERWPHGGYPDWLLSGPDFQMGALTLLAGADSAIAERMTANADEAAGLWLSNETHTRLSHQWLTAVAHELLPYSSGKSATHEDSNAPLLFVLLDAPAALQYASPDKYWRYAAQLKQSLISAGLDSNYLVTAATPHDAAARAPVDDAIGIAGKWIEWKGEAAETAAPQDSVQSSDLNKAEEAISLLTQSLRLAQPMPAIISNFSMESPLPAKIPTAAQSPADRFLSWSAFVTEGAAGVMHTDLQNTLPPAGYLMNDRGEDIRPYAAVDFSGDLLPHSERIRHERALVNRLGTFFASSHRRTILGIVDWRSGSAFSDAISSEVRNQIEGDFNLTLRKIDRVATLANIPAELVDLGAQSPALLGHNPVLLLVIPESLHGKQFLSASAQKSLLEFVRAGGALICNPELPLGDQFSDALAKADALPATDGVSVRVLGGGRIIVWSKTFFGWVNPDESVSASRAQMESAWAVENLQTLVTHQSASLPVRRSTPHSDELVASELVPDTPPLSGADSSSRQCKLAQDCTQGVLAVANWSDSEIQEILRILPPSISERTALPENYIELPVTLRPRDALFLPLDVPLCSAARKYEPCNDRVIAAGAEFVGATREGKFLELTFYAPSTATIVLHLAAPPRHLELPERTLQGEYVVAAQTFTMSLPRGSAPDFLRTVKIDLPYAPFVPEVPKPEHSKSRAFSFSVANAIRLPLGEGASLATNPPLIYLAPDLGGRVLVHVQNLGDSLLTLHVDISGVVAASRTLRLEPKERNEYALDVHGSGSPLPDSDGFLHGLIHISGGDKDSDLPIEFVVEDPKTILRYRKDFARDAAPSWVLENERLRLIVSPATDGSIAALVDKDSHTDILGAGGGQHDLLRFADQPSVLDIMRNIVFTADWDADSTKNAIHLHGFTPESFSAQLVIEKILRLLDANNLQIEYRLTPAPQIQDSPPAPNLISEFSFPAFAGGASGTQFCWDNVSTSQSATAQMHCEPFTPNARSIQVPQTATTIEIRSLNRATLSLSWHDGSFTIDQKGSFARLLWELPAVKTQSESQTYRLTLALGESR